MINQDLEYLLCRIISGKTYFFFNKERYCLESPTVDIKQKSLEIYFDIINDEKYNGWLREKDLENILINLGYWTFDTKNRLKELTKKIEKIKIDMYKNRFNTKLIKSLKNNLKNTNNEYTKLTSFEYEIYQHTLEGYANSIKNEYILCNSLYKNNKLVFKFNDNNSYLYFNSLLTVSNEHTIDLTDIRKLAKSSMWRSLWSCDKNNPFGISGASYLSNEQKAIINLSIMYDSVYDHPDSPEDFVIEDDDLLDGWMLFQKEKNKSDKQKSEISNLHKNSQEVFIMASEQEDIERISDMNDEYSKQIIKSRNHTLKNSAKGSVSHFDLPDVVADAEASMKR
jgi:hypothetical protein